ncbi:MAG TPA: acyl-CoA dehydrogenase family protein, partial [Polyangia bacterium]
MADFGADSETETFRAEARAWLNDNFPRGLAHAGGMGPGGAMRALTDDDEVWRVRMGEKGWGVPTWPKAYGGGGLNAAEARVLGEEMAAIGAFNPIGGMGVMMFGPTLIEYGAEALKRQHLPGIVTG